MINSKERIEELYRVIVSIKNEEDCKDFLEDLCTKNEIENMAQRVEAAKYLIDGETYDEIIKKTDISSATLSRVSRCVKYGMGYNKILKDNK